MSNLYDYFTAEDDGTAAATVDEAPDPEQFKVISVKRIDPVVQIGMLEALLRAVPYEQVRDDPRQGKLLTDPASKSRWVVSLTDTLRDALAAATADQLADVARPWAQTEEFGAGTDAEDLAGFLREFSSLARYACTRSHRLYCWISL